MFARKLAISSGFPRITFYGLVISGLFFVEPLSVHFQRFQIENVNLTCVN